MFTPVASDRLKWKINDMIGCKTLLLILHHIIPLTPYIYLPYKYVSEFFIPYRRSSIELQIYSQLLNTKLYFKSQL